MAKYVALRNAIYLAIATVFGPKNHIRKKGISLNFLEIP